MGRGNLLFPEIAIFLNQKIGDNRKINSRQESPENGPNHVSSTHTYRGELRLLRLCRGELAFEPLSLRWEAPKVPEIDAVVRVSWQRNSYKFAAEYKRQFNPKAIEAAAEQVREHALTARLLPLVVVPFLNERA